MQLGGKSTTMESIEGRVGNLITKLKQLRETDPSTFKDEAATKLGIILPILQILGWDVFNTKEVTPEYSFGSGRVDFALCLEEKPKVFIEVKKVEEELFAHQEQLIFYAFHEGVPSAILTNGYIWEFYLPLLQGNWQEKKVVAFDLQQQDIEGVAERFARLLSRDLVLSGEAEVYATELYGSRERERKIMETLPKAWEKIISERNEKLIELLAEEVESMCGFRPEETTAKDFLSRLAYSSFTEIEEVRTAPSARVIRRRRQRAGTRAEDPTGKIPSSVRLFGTTYQVNTWREVLLTVVNELIRAHPDHYLEILTSIRGRTRKYFSDKPQDLKVALRVDTEKVLYAEGNLNAKHIVGLCAQVLEEFGHALSDFKVTYR